jgi:ribosomal protein L37E
MHGYTTLEDKFEIKCKKCGSTSVTLSCDTCEECGETVNASCNKCKNSFYYHDFEKKEEVNGK